MLATSLTLKQVKCSYGKRKYRTTRERSHRALGAPSIRSQLQLKTTLSVLVPLSVTLPLLGTPSVTAFVGVVASRAVQRLVVVTHVLLNVPAPAANVTDPLHGIIDTTPAVVESAALPQPFSSGFRSITDWAAAASQFYYLRRRSFDRSQQGSNHGRIAAVVQPYRGRRTGRT